MRFSCHRRNTLALMVGLGLLLILPRALASTFHVSPFGSSTPPYNTYAKAAHDVADAVGASSGVGDTVLIHTGEYDIDTTIDISHGLTLAGISRDSVALILLGKPFTTTRMFSLFGNNEISALEFVNPVGAASDPGATSLYMDPVLSDGWLLVHECRFDELKMVVSADSDIVIRDNEILAGNVASIRTIFTHKGLWVHHNVFIGGWRTHAQGISTSSGDVLIEDNIFDFSQTDLRGDPIRILDGTASAIVRNNLIIQAEAPIVWNYTNGTFENNTIIGPEARYRTMHLLLDAGQEVTFRNNILISFDGGPQLSNWCAPGCTNPGTFIISHNAFWPPVESFYRPVWSDPDHPGTVIDTANMNAYPMFVDDSLYYLQCGSPLIDSGDASILDADGSRSDIGWTGGPFGTTYEYPEMAPSAPDSLWIDGDNGIAWISWSARPEADLSGYRVYRGTTPGFWTPDEPPIAEVAASETTYADTLPLAASSFYYVVTAFDTTGLESNPSPEAEYVINGVFDTTGQTPLPRLPRIVRTYPNPFNVSVTIDVYIPEVGTSPAPVEVTIYNLLGQVQATAFEGHLDPGNHHITWDGRTADGSPSASGLYFAGLRVWNADFGKRWKIVLLK